MQQRIIINDVEYDSPEEMPAEARRIYKELMKDRDGNGVPDVVDQLGDNNVFTEQRIIVNGRECKNLDELPPAVRETLAQLGSQSSSTRVSMGPQSPPTSTTPRWIWLALGVAAGAILTVMILKFASE